jgi:hypothetical protein
MTDLPVSVVTRSSRPRWFEPQLLGGVALVVCSLLVGAHIVTSAHSSLRWWTAGHDLLPGHVLSSGDLQARAAQLDSAAAYLTANEPPPLGQLVDRPIMAGELLPSAAVRPANERSAVQLVTLPVQQFHYPDALAPDQLVDVYVSLKANSGQAPVPSHLVASAMRVVSVHAGGSRFAASTVTGVALAVELPGSSAATKATVTVRDLVAAGRAGDIDLVLVRGPQ